MIHDKNYNTDYYQTVSEELDLGNEKGIVGIKYIEDLSFRKKFRDKNRKINTHNEDEILVRLAVLEAKVDKIYRALNFNNIVKATPIASLVYSDVKKCHDYVSGIYDKWIAYLTSMARGNKMGLTISGFYSNIDFYIFNNFFHDYGKKRNLTLSTQSVPEYKDVDYKNREFLKVEETNSSISITYSPASLQAACSARGAPGDGKEFNFGGSIAQDCMTKDVNVIDQIDRRGIPVSIAGRNKLVNTDKRFIILGSERPLFNTTVKTSQMKNLNETLHNVGEELLNYSLIIFHALLHFKCFIEHGDESKDHDTAFILEYINYTPSALFGHHLLPPVTIS